MLHEMALADSYGIAFEFVPRSVDRPNDLSGYYQHPTYADMTPGHYTDDTQRSIANALLVLGADEMRTGVSAMGLMYNPILYMNSYRDTYVRDPRPGYSHRYGQFLEDNKESRPVDMALALERKNTSGAVMGAPVLGYLSSPASVKLAAAAQALATHSYAAIPAAQIAALSAHYFIYGLGEKEGLPQWLYGELSTSSRFVADLLADAVTGVQPNGEVTMASTSAIRLALHLIPRHYSLSELIRHCVDVGGDTDTSAAITVAIASTCPQYTNDIPVALRDGLEDGQWGRDYLIGLDKQLASLVD